MVHIVYYIYILLPVITIVVPASHDVLGGYVRARILLLALIDNRHR